MNIEEAILEVQQSRSRYQLLKFAIGQHDSPEMAYYQLVIEVSGIVESIKRTKLKIKKLEAEIEELLLTGKKTDEIEAEIKKLDIDQLNLHLVGSQREFDYLNKLFESSPKYTREQIELNQEEYWEKRLLRVAHLQALSGAVSWAQLEAIYQAGLLEKILSSANPSNYLDLPPDALPPIQYQQGDILK